MLQVLVESVLTRCVLSISKPENSHCANEQNDERDEYHTVRVNFHKNLQVSHWCHPKYDQEYNDAGPTIRELTPVGGEVWSWPVLAIEQFNNEQNYREKVLGHQLEEYQDWDVQVYTKANHADDPTFLPKVSPQRLSIVNILTRGLDNHPTRDKRDNKRHKSKKDAQYYSRLLESPRHAHYSGAGHRIPTTEHGRDRSVLAILVLVCKAN